MCVCMCVYVCVRVNVEEWGGKHGRGEERCQQLVHGGPHAVHGGQGAARGAAHALSRRRRTGKRIVDGRPRKQLEEHAPQRP
jgi:hypothetical protein